MRLGCGRLHGLGPLLEQRCKMAGGMRQLPALLTGPWMMSDALVTAHSLPPLTWLWAAAYGCSHPYGTAAVVGLLLTWNL